jgi:hypothetical protein
MAAGPEHELAANDHRQGQGCAALAQGQHDGAGIDFAADRPIAGDGARVGGPQRGQRQGVRARRFGCLDRPFDIEGEGVAPCQRFAPDLCFRDLRLRDLFLRDLLLEAVSWEGHASLARKIVVEGKKKRIEEAKPNDRAGHQNRQARPGKPTMPNWAP